MKTVVAERLHLNRANGWLANGRILVLAGLLFVGSLSAHAGGRHHRYHHHYFGSAWRGHYYPGFSFYYSNAYPFYDYGPSYYPSYGYDYGYRRPNYALGGTLLGALTGGLIGNSIHRQGWEGAGIGAAAGLVLGSLADQSVRAREQPLIYSPQAQVSYVRPNSIANAPTVPNAPIAPPAPTIPANSARHTMQSANSLFGR